MSVFNDTFTRTGNLAGSSTETNTGTWRATGTITLDGDLANVQAGAVGYLTSGVGDADVSAQVASGYYAGIVVRSVAGVGGWRLEGYPQTFSSGGYQTVANYGGVYQYSYSYTDYRDTCPGPGSLTTVYQCGNSSFAGQITQSCGSHGSSVTYTLSSVTQQGTCQVYVPNSYTVSYSRVIDPTGAVVWSGQTAYAPVLRLRAKGSTITAWVGGTQVYTGADNNATSRQQADHGLYATSDAVSFTSFSLDTLNVPPNAPVVTYPASNGIVDCTQPVTLKWSFNDPDPGDTQSKFDIQYRQVGAATWVPASSETPISSYTIAAGTFPDAVQVEWQVRTYDSQGLQGSWSATSYFRAGTPPPPATWVAPVNGGTIPTADYAASWSSASQVAYQVRVIDHANGATLLDTGTVTSLARSIQLSFTTNQVTRELWVRIQAGGLWSTWAVATVTVSYTPPPVAVVFVTADPLRARIVVDLRTPDPTGTQPAVQFLDLYRQVDSGDEVRVAAQLTTTSEWIDWTPPSGAQSSYRAVSFGVNGTTSTSSLTS